MRRGAGFEAILEHQLDALHATAVRLTRDREEAADLLHDTVVRALAAYRSFEPGTNFRAWIFRILMNAFVSRHRSRMREPVEAVDDADTLREAFSLDPDHDPFTDERIERALLRLPESFRAAVVLVDLQGMSYREAASVLDCPPGTVMSRLSRGRALLRRHLRKIGEERALPRGEPR